MKPLLNEFARFRDAAGTAEGVWVIGEERWPEVRELLAAQFNGAGKWAEAYRMRQCDVPPPGTEILGLPVRYGDCSRNELRIERVTA